MEAIYIPKLLKAPDQTTEISINNSISGLDTLTPVKGTLIVRHGGNFLDVSVEAETIVTLICDRCVQNYNHRLKIATSELIWLEAGNPDLENLPLEREVLLEELSENLSPTGYFEPQTWIYEQLSLAMPIRQVCGESCVGATQVAAGEETTQVDNRWASLASLKEQLKNHNN
ncbi:putative metal-binding protein [Xenococcus sp. PCC 7305]|uniref:YceD family protein n=1 Tax=Xenococcus sp. PCC 7305 TaxID=102125 RepID=UPI0002AC14F0|nr:YceD family protein [Xenococcus sp. PCC 7305]ELS01978.1 putative metal-binding protein [Xenococcus sp. PCC 7305]